MDNLKIENQLFTEKEKRDLDKARAVRTRIIDEYIEDDLPSSFDMDRLLTAVSHLEAGAMNQAKLRIKQQTADGNDVNNALLAKLVLAVHDEMDDKYIQEAEYTDVDPTLLVLPDNLDVVPVEGGLRQGDSNPALFEEIFGK